MTRTNRIQFWRRQRGWTLQQLADAAGTTRAQIDKLERGARRLTVDWMVRLAKPLGCDPRSLMALADMPAPPAVDVIPLFRLRPARASGRISRAAAPQSVPRPYFLQKDGDAFAVIATDDVCAPALRRGQTAFIAPSRKPRAGQPVFVTHRDQSSAFYIFIKRSGGKIHLRQTHPVQDFVLAATAFAALAPVVGTAET